MCKNAFTVNKPEVFIGHSAKKFNADGELTDATTTQFIGEPLASLQSLAGRFAPKGK